MEAAVIKIRRCVVLKCPSLDSYTWKMLLIISAENSVWTGTCGCTVRCYFNTPALMKRRLTTNNKLPTHAPVVTARGPLLLSLGSATSHLASQTRDDGTAVLVDGWGNNPTSYICILKRTHRHPHPFITSDSKRAAKLKWKFESVVFVTACFFLTDGRIQPGRLSASLWWHVSVGAFFILWGGLGINTDWQPWFLKDACWGIFFVPVS